MNELLQQAADFWNDQAHDPDIVDWMQSLPVRVYINGLIGGEENPRWPMSWFGEEIVKGWRKGRGHVRALSIGCGAGALERNIAALGVADSIDAFDGSIAALHHAAAEARTRHLPIRYFAADFNAPAFPRNTYDIVFVHQALHHVAKIEKLYRAIIRTLKPGGLLYIDEYVGPSRFEWCPEMLTRHAGLLSAAPAQCRRREDVPIPLELNDPSEAIRSSDIVPLLEQGFDVVARRDYGGNLLSILYPLVDWSEAPPELLQRWIDEERSALRAGDPTYYTLIIARPKAGLAGLMSRVRYFTEPKLRRFGLVPKLRNGEKFVR